MARLSHALPQSFLLCCRAYQSASACRAELALDGLTDGPPASVDFCLLVDVPGSAACQPSPLVIGRIDFGKLAQLAAASMQAASEYSPAVGKDSVVCNCYYD